jgi:hypothetical protein
MDRETNRAGRVIKALIAKYFTSAVDEVEGEVESVREVFKGTNSRIRNKSDEDLSCA